MSCRFCGKMDRIETVTDLHGRADYITVQCFHMVRHAQRRCVECAKPHGGDWKRHRCERCAKARHAAQREAGNKRWRASAAGRAYLQKVNEQRRHGEAERYARRFWSDPEKHRAAKREWARRTYHKHGAPKRDEYLAKQREKYWRDRDKVLARRREQYHEKKAA